MRRVRLKEKDVQKFIECLKDEERSQNTIAKYARDVRKLIKFLDGRELSKELMLEFKEALIAKHKPSGVNSILAAIGTFLKYNNLEQFKVKPMKCQRKIFCPEEKELSKAPENLTEKQQVRLDMIQANDPVLFRAYRLKESLRLLFKLKDVNEAEAELKHWLWWASHSRIKAFVDLSKKIRRHKEHILNTIRYGLSNARIEATNNKIKLIIRKAYGFRNVQNMINMVYLVCSNIQVPLPNRKPLIQKEA